MIKLNHHSKIIIALMLFTQTLVAQDSASESDASASQQTNRQNTATEQSSQPQTSNTDTEDQVFIPSEEISEDAPVAFPVDI